MSEQLVTVTTIPYDLRFIDAMVMHHQNAVMSVKQMLSASKHPQLRDLGNRIVTAQQQQIDQLLVWRGMWYPGLPKLNTANLDTSGGMMSGGLMGSPNTITEAHNHNATASNSDKNGSGMMGEATTRTATNSAAPSGNIMNNGMISSDQADQMFLRMMIPHHQLAIDMAQAALKNAQHEELKQLSHDIISEQPTEITVMKDYLKTWYGEDSPRNPATPIAR